MEWGALKSKLSALIQKYRYGVIVLLVGVILMVLPSKTQQSRQTEPAIDETTQEEPLEQRLASILCRVSGAGEVQVMLTLSSGEETVYQADTDSNLQDTQNITKTNTITVTDSQRNESGLIRQINPPSYLGAIIVCQGADNPSVRLAIVEAVSNATGLGTDKISVLKMK